MQHGPKKEVFPAPRLIGPPRKRTVSARPDRLPGTIMDRNMCRITFNSNGIRLEQLCAVKRAAYAWFDGVELVMTVRNRAMLAVLLLAPDA
jgi:hypothetical protein